MACFSHAAILRACLGLPTCWGPPIVPLLFNTGIQAKPTVSYWALRVGSLYLWNTLAMSARASSLSTLESVGSVGV